LEDGPVGSRVSWKIENGEVLWLFEFTAINIRKVVKEGFAGKDDTTIDV
jgi:hypothetical protein